MNQAFWKTYKSKVLQTLSGESEEDLAEEVGTLHTCWVGHGQDSRSDRKRSKRWALERQRHICAEAVDTYRDDKQHSAVRQSGHLRKLRKKRTVAVGGVATVPIDLKGCRMEEILLGRVGSSHTGYM